MHTEVRLTTYHGMVSNSLLIVIARFGSFDAEIGHYERDLLQHIRVLEGADQRLGRVIGASCLASGD